MNEAIFITQFKEELIKELENEAEKTIRDNVSKFEEQLREKTTAKIVSYVNSLKVTLTQDLGRQIPKMIIEVTL